MKTQLLVVSLEYSKRTPVKHSTAEMHVVAKYFENTTPPLQVTPDHVRSSGLINSQSFHFLSTPHDLKPQIERLLELREEENLPRPLIVWEPAPRCCKPENLRACMQAATLVDVFSPNHIEFAALFDDQSSRFEQVYVESMVSEFLSGITDPNFDGVVVIRSGEHGCLLRSLHLQASWIPPYYSLKDVSKIVDTTGSGNAFLGAFACAYVKTKDAVIAAQHGAVAASFALEQIGLPVCEVVENGVELWNGVRVQERLRSFQSGERVSAAKTDEIGD